MFLAFSECFSYSEKSVGEEIDLQFLAWPDILSSPGIVVKCLLRDC